MLEEDVLVGAGLTEVVLVDSAEDVSAEETEMKAETEVVLVDLTEEGEEETGILKGMRCIQQYAINAVKTVKFLSGQHLENLFTVMIVINPKAGKPVRDQNLENNPEKHLMNTMTRSTKNLTEY